jgi:hypothetical protein
MNNTMSQNIYSSIARERERAVLRLLFRSKQGKSCSEEENDDEEEGRGPQIIVLPRITLNKHLGFRRDPFLSSFPVYKETKIFKIKEYHQQQNTYCK